MEVFRCTKYQIDKSRQMADLYGPASTAPHTTHSRQKIDQIKADHFLNYLFESGVLQDVAYGTTTLKYDSGDKQSVSHAVLTALKSHVIQDYFAYCSDVGCEPLSHTTLWNKLSTINPSQRRALGGLDNTTANGLQGIDNLTKLLKDEHLNFEETGLLSDKLEAGKCYIKRWHIYKMHCSDQSECAMHCCTFALSNPLDTGLQQTCDHQHTMSCPDCDNILATLDKILDQAEKKSDPEVLYDVRQNIDAIVEWIRHLLRGVQQDRAKGDEMKCLDNLEYAFRLKDYAIHIQGKQSDYFGKKGMSVHVDVFVQKNEQGKLTKLIYFTVLFRCDQDMLSTLNVAQHVLQQYKIDNSKFKIKKLLMKSDNAGCYSAGSAFQAAWIICKTLGITLERHDFNEPQCGKD